MALRDGAGYSEAPLPCKALESLETSQRLNMLNRSSAFERFSIHTKRAYPSMSYRWSSVLEEPVRVVDAIMRKINNDIAASKKKKQRSIVERRYRVGRIR